MTSEPHWNDHDRLMLNRLDLDMKLECFWLELDQRLFVETLWHEVPERYEMYQMHNTCKTVGFKFPNINLCISASLTADHQIKVDISVHCNDIKQCKTFLAPYSQHDFRCSKLKCGENGFLEYLASAERLFFLLRAMANLKRATVTPLFLPEKKFEIYRNLTVVFLPELMVEFVFTQPSPAIPVKRCIMAVDGHFTVLFTEKYYLQATDWPLFTATHFDNIADLIVFVKSELHL